jgi:hypothetical protein
MQHALVVGVGGEGVGEAVLGLHFRREHRPRVDAAGLGAEQPPPASEDGAELALCDRRDLADPLQLVFVEPRPDVVGDLGEDGDWMRGEEGGLVAGLTDGKKES